MSTIFSVTLSQKPLLLLIGQYRFSRLFISSAYQFPRSRFSEWIDCDPIIDLGLIQHCSERIHLTVYCANVDVSSTLRLASESMISVGPQMPYSDVSNPDLSEKLLEMLSMCLVTNR